MNMPKERIHVFHKMDIENILKDVGLFDEYEKGNLKCFFCEETVVQDNLFGFLVVDKKITPFCDKPDCSEKALQEKNNGDFE